GLAAAPARAMHACDEHSRKGKLCMADLAELHPTQMSVGMIEVREKEAEIARLKDDSSTLTDFEKDNPEPAVVGPGGLLFIIDHHHLARALWDQGMRKTYCEIVANYSGLSPKRFWKKLKKKAWVYPFDENGQGPYPYSVLPATVAELKDDP